jgi:hypothetical protein
MARRQLFLSKHSQNTDANSTTNETFVDFTYRRREQLRTDPTLISTINVFWDLVEKDEHGLIREVEALASTPVYLP